MERLGKLIRVRRATVVKGTVARVEFEDGSVRQLELSPFMRGPIFDELLQNPALFQMMAVQRGIITWPNGADVDPDVLYYGLTPASIGEADSLATKT